MSALVRNLLKTTIVDVLFLISSLSLMAFIIVKKDIDERYYQYIMFVIFAIASGINALLVRRLEKRWLCLLPLILLSFLPCVFFRGISVNTLILLFMCVIPFVFIIGISTFIKKNKKNTVKSLRKKYEKTHKK